MLMQSLCQPEKQFRGMRFQLLDPRRPGYAVRLRTPGSRFWKTTNIVLQLLCAVLALDCGAQTQPANPVTLKIAPVKASIDLDDRPIEITVWGSVSAAPSGISALALTIDLGGLQTSLTSILAAQLNRSDQCGERLTVDKAMLAPDAPAALLTANVTFERYACVKALGKQIVKKLIGGHAVIEVILNPSAEDSGIMLSARVRKIDADGSLGEVLRSGSFGDSIREEVEDSIEEAIQKSADLKSTLPAQIGDAATIQTIQFADRGAGKLWLTIGGEVRLSTDQLRGLMGK
jgi:hypothetical protein